MDLKVKFHFASEAGRNGKSTVVKVKTIHKLVQPEVFAFPITKQTSTQHVKLFNNSIVKNVVKSLKTRNKVRNIVLTLADELQTVYLDEEENIVFHDEYFEEVSLTPTVFAADAATEKSSRSKAKNIVLEKFNCENFQANT